MAAPTLIPSTLNWTEATATLSEALALKVTEPETVALLAGAVRDTVGGVVSGGAWVVAEAEEDWALLFPALS